MADFPRTVLPDEVSKLVTPVAAKSLSHSGLMQIRAFTAIGWSWNETWKLLNAKNADDMELDAYISYAANRGIIFEITHSLTPGSGIAPHGLGTAGILVKGAAQTGSSILVDGFPINTPNCVRGGDVFTFAGDIAVYRARAAAGSNGLGDVTIPLSFPLRASPADNAAVTNTGVKFTATVVAVPQFVGSVSPSYYGDYTVTFSEALI